MRLHLSRSACFAAGLLVSAAVFASARQLASQPAASGRVDQITNDQVHVWRTTVLPHQPLALHRHDHARVIVALTDGTMNFVDQAGHIEVAEWKHGQSYYYPAMPPGTLHADVNAGDAPLQVIVIELEHEK